MTLSWDFHNIAVHEGHVPSPSLVSLKVTNQLFPCSTLAIFSFNGTNNKEKIKPVVIYQREIIEAVLFVQRWIFIGCGYAMYFQDIQTPRSQFKKSDKFGLTSIFPINTACKNFHQQESKNYPKFIPHAFRAKGGTMCHVYPLEDCVKGSRVIYSNYHNRNMTPSYTSL